MSVAALITDESQIDDMIDWGRTLAACESTELVVLILQKSSSEKQWIEWTHSERPAGESLPSMVTGIAEKLFVPQSPDQETSLAENAGNGDPQNPETDSPDNDKSELQSTIRVLKDRKPEWALVDDINSLGIKILLLPKIPVGKATSEVGSWGKSLYRQAPCEIMQLDCQLDSRDRPIRTLVIATGGLDDFTAIKRATKIAKCTGGTTSAVYFQPDIDPVAKAVGKKILGDIVSNAVGQQSLDIEHQVVLASSTRQGLDQIDLSKFDLVICGTRNLRSSVSFLSSPVFKANEKSICAATIRKPAPLTNWFVNRVQSAIEGVIPQLKRDERIELVNRVHSSSKWDFDFGVLVCLSTLIAALGLIRNSSSVVIGAMLVAPLMTPIVGTGLGLAQGNFYLMQNSMRTVLRGFATAFLIGIVIGLITRPAVTLEMSARGSPNVLDLVVALASGMAAAYALGRPNLLSALPGVAIAAALVPPLATSGIAFSMGLVQLSFGSLVLFGTNIVAIILGTAFTFWIVGVRWNQKDSDARNWPLWLFLIVVLLSILIGVMMTLHVNLLE